MSTLVVDIETLGEWTADQAAAIAEMAEARDMEPEAFAALSPPLAHVVCVGILDLDRDRELAVFDVEALATDYVAPNVEGHVGERGVLTRVSEVLGKASRIVTFNGRGFDLPTLIHRSIANGVRPAPKIVAAAREYRYKPNLHIDVRDQFTFFGAASAGTLRAFALGYGLADPKAEGSGAGVSDLVAAHDAEKLTRYCLGDCRTTAALYRRWLDAVGMVA